MYKCRKDSQNLIDIAKNNTTDTMIGKKMLLLFTLRCLCDIYFSTLQHSLWLSVLVTAIINNGYKDERDLVHVFSLMVD